MGKVLTPEGASKVLDLDAWALQRLVELGEIAADASGEYDADAVEALASARETRREEALTDISALDAPYLGLKP